MLEINIMIKTRTEKGMRNFQLALFAVGQNDEI